MKLKRLLLKFERIYEKYGVLVERGYFLKYTLIYKFYLRLLKCFKFSPIVPKNVIWRNTTLKTKIELEQAIDIIKKSKLNIKTNVIEKNWDSLIALSTILQNTDRNAVILDAGGQLDSLILHWLFQFGYKNLSCLNLTFKKRIKRGNIEFLSGDLTMTNFPNNYFDIITCISVIEHGVDKEKYFEEMHRILKKGGLLITSTDYWETKLETSNKYIYNNPVYIFDKNSIQNLLEKAKSKGFQLFGPEVDLSCREKVVHWRRFNLKFTFLIFCLQKD
ncbi:MAG: class I SAM-dependent methyltransferase [Promethearchaeota archaeon]